MGEAFITRRGGKLRPPDIFGNGRDGDLYIAQGETVVLPVTVPHQSVVEMQYQSITIETGGLLKCSHHNAGLLIRCRGDCTVNGTIDQSSMAPFTNPNNAFVYPPELITGNGGGGGGVYVNTDKGGAAMLSRTYGGGYGGGGCGGFLSVDGLKPEQVGGDASLSTVLMGKHTGYGGECSRKHHTGGEAGGGNGIGDVGQENYGGCGGGGGWAGGIIMLYVAGKCFFGGLITCRGGNGGGGGYGGRYNSTTASGGGGGGGGGGGALYLCYKDTVGNTAALDVSGGVGGSGGTASSMNMAGFAGQNGGNGTVTFKQYERGMRL